MTIVDVFISLPLWAKIVVGVICFIFAIETILTPFKFNMCINSIKRMEALIEQYTKQSRANEEANENIRKLLPLLIKIIGEKDS